uniref:Uncharacterized protein n=2 Tax=Lutzomyia longipalpis TaxID=7200 RepID=A0A1B0CHC0_LUTLO
LNSEKIEAEENVEDVLDSLNYINQTIPHNHELRFYVNIINRKVPVELMERYKRKDVEQNMSSNLHSSERSFRSEFSTTTQSRFNNPKAAWYWYCLLRPPLMKALAVATAFLSVTVVWSEMTFFSRSPVLSIFANVVNLAKRNYDFLTIELFSMFVLCYLCYCAYSTVFRIKFLNLYYLAPHHQTNEHSLIFCGMLLCRLTPPICLNFLGLIHMDSHIIKERISETFYTQVMGHMDVLEIIADGFNIYFPMLMIAFCLATWFNVGSRTLSALGFQQFMLSKLNSEKIEAEENVEDVLDSLNYINQTIPHNHELRFYVNIINRKVPVELMERYKRKDVEQNMSSVMPSEKSLSRLHRQVIKSLQVHQRTQALWNIQIEKVLHCENVLKNLHSSERSFRSEFSTSTQSRFYNPKAAWYWYCLLRPPLMKALAVATAFLSVTVVWSEMTFFSRSPVLSIFANVVNLAKRNYDFLTIELFSMFVLCYLCYCAYSTERISETFYTQVMGHMDVLEIIADGFNIYFPMLMIAFCLATWFNVGSRTLSALGFQQFMANEDMSDEIVQEGKDLISREKRKKRRMNESSTRRRNGTELRSTNYLSENENTQIASDNFRVVENTDFDDIRNNITQNFALDVDDSLNFDTDDRIEFRAYTNDDNGHFRTPTRLFDDHFIVGLK